MIKKKLNSKKGITIISLIIIIIILLILSGVIIENVDNSSKVAGYNNMISDIKLLEDKLLVYFNKYREIPKTSRSINIDSTNYYEIDLSKLDNITLNYGQEYGESDELFIDKSDVYVVNDSLEVYYVQGINLNGERYYKISDGREDTELEYIEIEYIESAGTQYIDTGLKLNQNSIVELKAQVTEKGDYNIFGSRSSATENNFAILFSNASHNLVSADFQNYNKNRLSTNPSSESIVYKISNKQLQIGDATKNINEYTNFITPNNVYIFDISGNKPTYNLAKMKLYYCKIWDNGTLVRDFIPCENSNGVVCLYDKVEGKYYYNQGTGEFVAGPKT